MEKITRRFFFIILGLVILIWPGVVRDASAQSVNLEKVTVGPLSFPSVEVVFSFEGLDNYEVDNDGLEVFILKYTIDPQDGIKKYMPHETMSSADYDFITMIDDGIQLSFSDIFSNHDSGSERYALELGNLATGTTLGDMTPGHQTIFLDGISDENIDRCNGSISLSWENYKHFQTSGNVADSDVELQPFFRDNRIMYMLLDGGGEQVAATLDFEDEEFEFHFEDGPGDYLIWVQAVELDDDGITELRTSNSNYRTVKYPSPALTDLEITLVNVVENRDINVVFYAEEGQPDDLDDFVFEVYRADDLEGEYALVGEGAPSSPSGYYSFTDNNVPGLRSGPYYYYVSGRLDECEIEFSESTVVSSLFLEGVIDVDTETQLMVRLAATHFPVGMDYQLSRKFTGEPGEHEWISLGSLVPYETYIDDLSLYIEELAGEISYRVEGTAGTGGIFYSNVVIITINVGLEVFNAFRPASRLEVNQTFRPRLRGVTPALFRLLIYNNWGQEIYSFTNQSGSLNDWDGWDGTTKDGNEAPAGVYGYRLEYQIGTGPREEVMGTVMLVR